MSNKTMWFILILIGIVAMIGVGITAAILELSSLGWLAFGLFIFILIHSVNIES